MAARLSWDENAECSKNTNKDMSGGWGGMLVSFWQDWQEYVKVKIQSDAQKQSVKDSVMRFLAEDSFTSFFAWFFSTFWFFRYRFTQCFHIFSIFPARVSISDSAGAIFLCRHSWVSCVTHGWSPWVSCSKLFLQHLLSSFLYLVSRIHWGGPAWFHALL